MARLASASAILLALLAVAFFAFGGNAPPDRSPDAPADAPTMAPPEAAVLASQQNPTDAIAAAPDERELVVDASAAPTCSLQLTVLWASDKQPATAIEVSISRRGIDALFDAPRGRTDAAGQFVFDNLMPGKVTPTCTWGESHWGKSVVLTVGQRVEATIEIPIGMLAKGRVVDGDGAAIAGASIVVSGWGGGGTEVVAQSAADGTFSLRSMPLNCHIGARKRDYRPSSMRTVTTSEGGEVEFTIVMTKDGGTIAGRVVDPNGQPIAGALVRSGSMRQDNHKLPDGGGAMAPQCEIVRTDEDGRFEVESVVPGKVPLAVRKPGLAPWTGEVDVAAGRREEITIALQPGVTLFGIAKGDDGALLEKVSIRIGEWQDFGTRSTSTDATGGYRIEGLGPGTFVATADHDERGKAETSLQFVAGETRRWDPVLAGGATLRGRVLDAEQKPVASVMVEGMPEPWQAGDRWSGFANTDAEGRFTMRNCMPGRTVRLTLRRKSTFPELTLHEVAPQADELVIHLPETQWVHIVGTVLGPDDKVVANVNLSPILRDSNSGTPVETPDVQTGAFRLGPYPPGTYLLHIAAGGYPTLRLEHTLQPNETWDVGTLHFAVGGTLVAQLVAAVESAPTEMQATIYDPAGRYVERPTVTAGVARSGPLAAGDYELQVSASGIAMRAVPFAIRAEAETRIDVSLVKGVDVQIACEPPVADPKLQRVAVLVTDEAGAVVWRGSLYRRSGQPGAFVPSGPQGTYAGSVVLARGHYTVAATADALSGTESLIVGEVATSVTIRLAATTPR